MSYRVLSPVLSNPACRSRFGLCSCHFWADDSQTRWKLAVSLRESARRASRARHLPSALNGDWYSDLPPESGHSSL